MNGEVYHLNLPRSAHTVYLCVLYGSKKKQQFISVFQHQLFDFDDWLTVHRTITLVNFQLGAQNSYLFIYNTFIKILYMFRALPCLSFVIVYMQPLVSSLSAGDCPVHRLRKNSLIFTAATEYVY